MRLQPEHLRVCLVTDRSLARGRSLVDVVGAALRGGATMVQLREKEAGTREFVEEARALKPLLEQWGAPLIVNDRIDVALAIGADGVHLGQTDMPLEVARALLGPDKTIGLSITNERQMLAPDAGRADYLGLGPIYAQTTKRDASMPLGPEGFSHLRAMTSRPVVAIGGLTLDNAAPVIAVGADGLAVVSAIMSAHDPQAVAAAFARLFA